MKRFTMQLSLTALVLYSLSGLCNPIALAESQDALSLYEEALFSQAYEGQSQTDRLNRLEQAIFGSLQSGTPTQRQTNLLKVLQSIPRDWKEPAEAATTSSTGGTEDTEETGQSRPAQRPDATDYPTVTALERQVFSRDFTRDDVSVRLNRLEKKVFGQPHTQMGLSERVDALLAKYPDARLSRLTGESASASPSVLQGLPSDSSQFAGSNLDVYTKVETLEKALLNGKSAKNELLTQRLDRLEQRTFGRSYMGESIDTRVNRLTSQFKTSNQVPRKYQPSLSSQPPQVIYQEAPRQNVQIGAGLSQSSRMHFSQDLLDMLPDDVRAQVQSGTIVSAPSTVIIEKSTTQTPGFQPYGAAPMQYYNYYGSPGSVQTQTQTTTVIQPNGSTVVYGYPGSHPNGLPNPAYIGDPVFLQQLNSVEANVFGQVNANLPIQARLNALETTVIGRNQANLPEQERLNAIFRTWKIKQISRMLNGGNGKTGPININSPLRSSGQTY